MSDEKLAENWCTAMGHRVRHGFCTNCGKDESYCIADAIQTFVRKL